MGITPVAVLDVCVPSSVFLYNNIRKVENGEKARGSVVFAQGAKIAQAVAKYHDSTANGASEAYNIFGKYANKSKILDYTGKGINWATRNVNPLICASAAYKTAKSDKKVHTGITQIGALSGMFLGEGLMKRNSDKVINEENIKKLAEKLKDVKGFKSIAKAILEDGHGGKIASIIKGIAFVAVSMTSYNIGQKLGEDTADRICADIGIEVPENQQEISSNECVKPSEPIAEENQPANSEVDEEDDSHTETESLESQFAHNIDQMG